MKEELWSVGAAQVSARLPDGAGLVNWEGAGGQAAASFEWSFRKTNTDFQETVQSGREWIHFTATCSAVIYNADRKGKIHRRSIFYSKALVSQEGASRPLTQGPLTSLKSRYITLPKVPTVGTFKEYLRYTPTLGTQQPKEARLRYLNRTVINRCNSVQYH
ncbi:hypothetical protein VTK56DRAFT_8716 [Thermocarpiscus australiensis]